LISAFLQEREAVGASNFFKKPDEIPKALYDASQDVLDLSLLMAAFGVLLEKVERKAPPPRRNFEGVVGRETVSISAMAARLMERFKEERVIKFESVFRLCDGRAEMITAFLALLELIRLECLKAVSKGNTLYIQMLKEREAYDF
jgi:chromatin segregation and condensation protein Rec8/ScpA/Scc1 (kleisin family)